MANFFKGLSQIFGFSKKSKKDVGGQPYQGPRPLGSLTEVPETGPYLQTLKERIAGLKVGIPESVLDAYEGPLAKQAYGLFSRYQAPAISASASARGLGRSTVPVAIEAQKRAEIGESLAERLSRLKISNEELKRQEILDAISRTGGYIGAEAATKAGRSAFEQGEFLRGEAANAAIAEAQEKGIGRLITTIASLGLGAATGNPLMATAGLSGAFVDTSSDDLINLLLLTGGLNTGATVKMPFTPVAPKGGFSKLATTYKSFRAPAKTYLFGRRLD